VCQVTLSERGSLSAITMLNTFRQTQTYLYPSPPSLSLSVCVCVCVIPLKSQDTCIIIIGLLRTIDECTLTVNMRKSTEDSAWAVTSLLHVVTFGRFVYLRMKLLFRTRMAIRTCVTLLAVARFTPFLAVFHIRAWRWPVLSTQC